VRGASTRGQGNGDNEAVSLASVSLSRVCDIESTVHHA
jgi:hypothetical protein